MARWHIRKRGEVVTFCGLSGHESLNQVKRRTVLRVCEVCFVAWVDQASPAFVANYSRSLAVRLRKVDRRQLELKGV